MVNPASTTTHQTPKIKVKNKIKIKVTVKSKTISGHPVSKMYRLNQAGTSQW